MRAGQQRVLVPKYLQVANHFRDEIVRGRLRPGDELPSERDIAAAWGISRPTATRALAQLRNEGLTESRQGSGTYVLARPRLTRRSPDRFDIQRTAKVLDAELVDAPNHIAAELGISHGDPVVRRRDLIAEPDGAAELATSWVDGRLVDRRPRLLEPTALPGGTVAYVEKATKRRAATARDLFAARLATAQERQLLGMDGRAAAVLVVQHTVRDSSGGGLVVVEAVHGPGRWWFEQDYGVRP